MPIDVELTGSYLSVRLYDVVTPAELLSYARSAEEFEQQHGGPLNRITDLTGVVRFEIGYREIFDFADRRKRGWPTEPSKSVIIAIEPVQIGMARMFQTMSSHPNLDIRIVNSHADAQAWLSVESGTHAELLTRR